MEITKTSNIEDRAPIFPYSGAKYIEGLKYDKRYAGIKFKSLCPVNYPFAPVATTVKDTGRKFSFSKKFSGVIGLSEDAVLVPALDFPGCLISLEYGHMANLRSKNVVTPFRKDDTSDRLKIRVKVDGEYRTSYVHKAVYTAAYGPVFEGHEIHHLDNNCINNRLDNLAALSKEQHNEVSRQYERETRREREYTAKILQLACGELDKEGTIVNTYPSRKEAAKAKNGRVADLRRHLNGKAETFAGSKWANLDHEGRRMYAFANLDPITRKISLQ